MVILVKIDEKLNYLRKLQRNEHIGKAFSLLIDGLKDSIDENNLFTKDST